MKCYFLPEIIAKNQDGTMGKMLPARPSKVQNLLQKNQTYVWYQDDIYLDEHRLVGTSQFETTGRKKLKYPNMIDDKEWKELGKEGQKKGRRREPSLQIPNKLFHWGGDSISVFIVEFLYCKFKQ